MDEEIKVEEEIVFNHKAESFCDFECEKNEKCRDCPRFPEFQQFCINDRTQFRIFCLDRTQQKTNELLAKLLEVEQERLTSIKKKLGE